MSAISARKLILAAVGILVIATPPPAAFAQQRFEVASIRQVPEGERLGRGDVRFWLLPPRVDNPQHFRAINTVSRLIEWAYRVRDFQILNGPAWIRDDQKSRYEILANAEQSSSDDEFRAMVRELLADRFQLKLRRENRETPTYVLVVGKNGPKLPPAKDATLNDGQGIFTIGNGALRATGGTMAMLAKILTDNLERPVIDRTNLAGHYDFSLTYGQPQAGPMFTPMNEAIFVPIQELGLRIEAQREPVEFLVIDSVSRPSEN